MNASHDIERTAHRRARAKLGWIVHALVYVGVSLVLAAAAYASGRYWAVFPSMGWGLALLIHGAVVFFITGGGGLYAQLLDRERSRLQLQRDPW